MPISLPPISRRSFLKRSLLAGAGIALAPSVLRAAAAPDENSWALLADPHIAAESATVSRGVNMSEHLVTVGRDVIGLETRPSGAFVLGDCAFSNGQKEDYATLTKLLEPIRGSGIPVHLTLGNHDNRERFREALTEEQGAGRLVAGHQAALLRTARVNWFVLDSLEKTLSTPGMIGPEQLTWLATALDENPDRAAVILIHHNPNQLASDAGVKDTEALFKVLRPRKQVKAYIFGHTHDWSVTQDESGIHLVNLPPVSYVFRDGNPSGWALASLSEKGMRLELRCTDRTHAAHRQITDLKWRTG